eukprot:TRINITY_DN3162_c0_g1_i1.p1 TRINITY_DN3162_c0_g1~~TRINITY_DN3162_c0_g1_i1.p1  ORF type:complete len:282 (-),score=29.79 TRINITY_DN3162_c0_g1_i1:1119-1964(-)
MFHRHQRLRTTGVSHMHPEYHRQPSAGVVAPPPNTVPHTHDQTPPTLHEFLQRNVDAAVTLDDPRSLYRPLACMLQQLPPACQCEVVHTVLVKCLEHDPNLDKTRDRVAALQYEEEQQAVMQEHASAETGPRCDSLKVVFADAGVQQHYTQLFNHNGALGALRPSVTSVDRLQQDDHVLFVINLPADRLDDSFYTKQIDDLPSDHVHVLVLRFGPKVVMQPQKYQYLKEKHQHVKTVLALNYCNNRFVHNDVNTAQLEQFCDQLRPKPKTSSFFGSLKALW